MQRWDLTVNADVLEIDGLTPRRGKGSRAQNVQTRRHGRHLALCNQESFVTNGDFDGELAADRLHVFAKSI